MKIAKVTTVTVQILVITGQYLYLHVYIKLLNYSINHALPQLVDQIYESFEGNGYTIRVFIDLSKTFDTVEYIILMKKLETYGKFSQYIQIDGKQKTNYKTVKKMI